MYVRVCACATSQINSLNRRAMQLLEQQQELERAAEARWNSSMSLAGGELWVGHLLPTVDIDDWGTFKFLVIRVRGRNDKQCIIVRGKNYCTEAQIIEDVNRKVSMTPTHTHTHIYTHTPATSLVLRSRQNKCRSEGKLARACSS